MDAQLEIRTLLHLPSPILEDILLLKSLWEGCQISLTEAIKNIEYLVYKNIENNEIWSQEERDMVMSFQSRLYYLLFGGQTL